MNDCEALDRLEWEKPLNGAELESLANFDDLDALMARARAKRDEAFGDAITYSRKVFIPLTQLCRDVCSYCTFAKAPKRMRAAYLSREEVLAIARAGKSAGCREALFTLGDKPELRYENARRELERLGHASTLSYLAEVSRLVFEETGLFPHVNPGVMDHGDLALLRETSLSQGVMLENISERLCARGGPHFGSPDKAPAPRIETLRLAGELSIPFTTGLLIGIGETRLERLQTLMAIRDLHERYGHIQEAIIQNFRPKVGTRMARHDPASVVEHLWTIAMARLVLPEDIAIQAPPNLSPDALSALIAAGVNDWGGVSPVTPDHVNPEAPWPNVQILAQETARRGKTLRERLAIYPPFAATAARWVNETMRPAVLRCVDGEGLPRSDDWAPGADIAPPADEIGALRRRSAPPLHKHARLRRIVDRLYGGGRAQESDIVALFKARGGEFGEVCAAADALRRDVVGDEVSYVVTRNINYTNICYFKCQFCAFSKGKLSENLRGRPYDLALGEIERRAYEAWTRGASEVCMQGGIHPSYTGRRYIEVCQAVKRAAPAMHVHAFSPLEIHQGAATIGLSIGEFLVALRESGLGTLPGTAAEILDDDVRAVICPDKIDTARWLEVMRHAHRAGIRSTATIMFGHVERYDHLARHLLRILDLQVETGGFTEFVPLPFVPFETPMYLKGRARRGATFRESVLMHAAARLVFRAHIPNIQTSWVKMGERGARLCLDAGVNDLGGTLMDETISRSAGASHGQEMSPPAMEAIIRSARRTPRQRTTLYADAPAERRAASLRPEAA